MKIFTAAMLCEIARKKSEQSKQAQSQKSQKFTANTLALTSSVGTAAAFAATGSR